MSDYLERMSAVDSKRMSVMREIAKLQGALKALEAEALLIAHEIDLPTEPGWYITANNTPARLTDDGVWDDGWGNSGADYEPVWHPLPLTRLIPEGSE